MGLARNDPTQLLAYDYFEQAEANLDAPVAMPLGGNWAETNKTGANGFKVIAASDLARRTAVSDTTLNSGCFAQAGSTAYTTFSATLTVKSGTQLRGSTAGSESRVGLLGRYVSTEKWLIAVLGFIGGEMPVFSVIKSVPGTVTVIATQTLNLAHKLSGSGARALRDDTPMKLWAAANGSWAAECGDVKLSGQDDDLATGGTLATGKVGLYDAMTSASSATRDVDDFYLMATDPPGVVCYSGKRIEFRSDGVERQDASGSYYGPPSMVRGGNLYLAPAGDSGRINRIAIRMRRNDIETEPDTNVTDRHTVEVLVTERYLIPR
jgi:hypothetical protein